MSFLCDPWKWWINGLVNSLGLGFLKNCNYMPDTQTGCLFAKRVLTYWEFMRVSCGDTDYVN